MHGLNCAPLHCRQKQKEKQEELEKQAVELAAKLKQACLQIEIMQTQKRVLQVALNKSHEATPKGHKGVSFVSNASLGLFCISPDANQSMRQSTINLDLRRAIHCL